MPLNGTALGISPFQKGALQRLDGNKRAQNNPKEPVLKQVSLLTNKQQSLGCKNICCSLQQQTSKPDFKQTPETHRFKQIFIEVLVHSFLPWRGCAQGVLWVARTSWWFPMARTLFMCKAIPQQQRKCRSCIKYQLAHATREGNNGKSPSLLFMGKSTAKCSRITAAECKKTQYPGFLQIISACFANPPSPSLLPSTSLFYLQRFKQAAGGWIMHLHSQDKVDLLGSTNLSLFWFCTTPPHHKLLSAGFCQGFDTWTEEHTLGFIYFF